MSFCSTIHFGSEPDIEAIGYKRNIREEQRVTPELFFPSLKVALNRAGFEHVDGPRNKVYKVSFTSVSRTYSFRVNQLALKEIFEEKEAASKTIRSDPLKYEVASDKLKSFLFNLVPDDGLYEEVSRTVLPYIPFKAPIETATDRFILYGIRPRGPYWVSN